MRYPSQSGQSLTGLASSTVGEEFVFGIFLVKRHFGKLEQEINLLPFFSLMTRLPPHSGHFSPISVGAAFSVSYFCTYLQDGKLEQPMNVPFLPSLMTSGAPQIGHGSPVSTNFSLYITLLTSLKCSMNG